MPGPPASRADRRARQVQLRRRQLALGGILVLVVLAAVVALTSGGGAGTSRTSAGAAPAGRSGSQAQPSVRFAGHHRPLTPSQSRELERLAQIGRPVYCAGPHGNAVAFTFDDGPGPYTHYAIKKLTEAHQQATFFTVGRSIDNFPGWLNRELKVGVIADHTQTHPVLTSLPSAEIEAQIAATAQKIQQQTGQRVQLFRPPYGARNATVDAIARRLGLVEILWNIDSADSLGAEWDGIIRNVEAGLHPGSIILMHENRGQTIRALTTLLPELQRRHLRSLTLPELLSSDPPSAAQLRAGPAGCSGAVLHGSGG